MMVLNILAPNDGFLLTTLKLNTFKVIQSSLHYKRGRGYENLCIYSLIVVGELEPFWNYKGFSIIFPKILEAIYHIFPSENFRFIFFYQNSLT